MPWLTKKTQNPKDNYQETAFKHFSQLKIYREARTSNLSEPCLIHTVRFQVSKSILIILSSDSKYESGMTCRQSCLITHLWKALSRPHPPAHSKMPLRSMISGLSYIPNINGSNCRSARTINDKNKRTLKAKGRNQVMVEFANSPYIFFKTAHRYLRYSTSCRSYMVNHL